MRKEMISDFFALYDRVFKPMRDKWSSPQYFLSGFVPWHCWRIRKCFLNIPKKEAEKLENDGVRLVARWGTGISLWKNKPLSAYYSQWPKLGAKIIEEYRKPS